MPFAKGKSRTTFTQRIVDGDEDRPWDLRIPGSETPQGKKCDEMDKMWIAGGGDLPRLRRAKLWQAVGHWVAGLFRGTRSSKSLPPPCVTGRDAIENSEACAVLMDLL